MDLHGEGGQGDVFFASLHPPTSRWWKLLLSLWLVFKIQLLLTKVVDQMPIVIGINKERHVYQLPKAMK
jgi:hypothetical protein